MFKKTLFFIVLLIALFQLKNVAQETDSSKTYAINEVTVSAYRTESDLGKIPHQVKIIKNEEINSLPANGLDDLLKKSAGIDLVQYPGFSSVISMRGFAPTGSGNAYTLILVDGIPAGTDNIATLNLDNTSQVEVLKGPFSSFFGTNAMGGVINMATKRSGEQLTGRISLAYGSFNRYKIKANIGGAITPKLNFDFYANTNAQKSNYTTGNNNLLKLNDKEKLIMEEKSYGKEYDNTQFSQYAVGGRLGFVLNEDWEIHLKQDYWLAKNIQTNGTFWGVYGEQGKDINRWSQSLSLEGSISNHEIRFSPHYSIENTIYLNDLSNNSYRTDDNSFRTYGFILQDAINIGNHRIILGIDNLSKKHQSERWADAENQASPYQPDYLNMATGIYVQANFNLLDNRLNASVGGRYDNIIFKLFETPIIENAAATENYNIFNPNIGIQYKFMNGFKLHTAFGTAFLAPDAFKVAGDYTYSIRYRGNPDLKPETSITYDIGLAYNNRKLGLSTDVTYFTTNYKNKVVYDYTNYPEYISFMNANKANMDGLEVYFNYDFGALNSYKYHLKIYLDYTHLYNTKETIDGVTGSVEQEMKYVRMNKASFGISFENKGLSARINGRYIGNRFEDNWLYNTDYNTGERVALTTTDGQEIRPELIYEDVLRHPDFLLFDLSASYTFKRKYTVGLIIDNLLDENYTEKDSYYMPGRSFMASFSFNL